MAYYTLPITDDADRTYSCLLGGQLFHFRMYFSQGADSFWLLDVYDGELRPLAVGRRLVNGSINVYKGYANGLSRVSLTCGFTRYPVGASDMNGITMNLLWTSSVEEELFADGEPMDTLYENFYITQ